MGRGRKRRRVVSDEEWEKDRDDHVPAREPRPISHIQCGLCHRSPSGEPKSEPNAAQANLHVSTNLPSPTLPSLSWPLIFRFVGAHILQQEDWPCSQCKPSWHSWYCQRCRMCVPPAWTCQKHFGSCGQSCSCCRFEHWEALGSCEECEDLWVLKATSGEVRLALLSYDGR